MHVFVLFLVQAIKKEEDVNMLFPEIKGVIKQEIAATNKDEYEYIIPDNMEVKADDFVLIDARGSLKVVFVKEVSNEPIYSGNTKVILSKIDFTDYFNYQEKQKKLAQLEQKLEKMYAKLSKLQILKTLVANNKEMKELLDEYEKLGEIV